MLDVSDLDDTDDEEDDAPAGPYIPGTPPPALAAELRRRFPDAFQDERADAVLAADQHQRQDELAQLQQQWREMADRMDEAMGGDDVDDPCTICYARAKTSRPDLPTCILHHCCRECLETIDAVQRRPLKYPCPFCRNLFTDIVPI